LEENENEKDLLKVICSFYRMEMIFLVNSKFRINSINDIKNTINQKKKEKKTFKLGVLDKTHSSHRDAYKILNCMNIDYKSDSDKTGIEIIEYKSMRELIYYFDENEVDFIYLTTTSKNKFIIELLKQNFVNVIGINDIGESLLRTKFDIIHKNLVNTSKFNRIIKENDDLFSYNSSEIMGKKLNADTFSTRLYLICRKELDNRLIYNIIQKIYSNRIKLKEKMTKYFLTNRNNTLDKLMDPHEMFFTHEDLQLHTGAHKYFEDIGFISKNKNMSLLNKKIKSKLLLDNHGPYQQLSIRK
jgi:TRAP-type uncharacterized transport system substrate-binding protein